MLTLQRKHTILMKMRLKLFTSIILLWCTFAAYGQKRPHIRHNHKRTNVDHSSIYGFA